MFQPKSSDVAALELEISRDKVSNPSTCVISPHYLPRVDQQTQATRCLESWDGLSSGRVETPLRFDMCKSMRMTCLCVEKSKQLLLCSTKTLVKAFHHRSWHFNTRVMTGTPPSGKSGMSEYGLRRHVHWNFCLKVSKGVPMSIGICHGASVNNALESMLIISSIPCQTTNPLVSLVETIPMHTFRLHCRILGLRIICLVGFGEI